MMAVLAVIICSLVMMLRQMTALESFSRSSRSAETSVKLEKNHVGIDMFRVRTPTL